MTDEEILKNSNFRIDFMIIGAQKCGTTTLAMQLARHPEICLCRKKEPGYFNIAKDWRIGLDKYHRLYLPSGRQLCGEASTMYTFLPEYQETHSRIFAYNPEIKLIYIMRQPVERIISHYAHRLLSGRVREIPEIAILKNPVYLNRSRYGVQIRPYLDLFPARNVYLLLFEEYIADPLRCLSGIALFLGISPSFFQDVDSSAKNRSVGRIHLKPSGKKITRFPAIKAFQSIVPSAIKRALKPYFANELTEKPEFSAELKATLWMFLEDDVRTIESLLGRRLDVWRKGY